MKLKVQLLSITLWMICKCCFWVNMFGCQHKKEVVGFWVFSFPFKEILREKIHNLLFLMLDLRFRNLYLLSSPFNHEQMKAIMRNMIKIFISHVYEMSSSFAPLGWIWNQHCWLKSWWRLQWILDVFEMTTNTIELARELVNRELLIF